MDISSVRYWLNLFNFKLWFCDVPRIPEYIFSFRFGFFRRLQLLIEVINALFLQRIKICNNSPNLGSQINPIIFWVPATRLHRNIIALNAWYNSLPQPLSIYGFSLFVLQFQYFLQITPIFLLITFAHPFVFFETFNVLIYWNIVLYPLFKVIFHVNVVR